MKKGKPQPQETTPLPFGADCAYSVCSSYKQTSAVCFFASTTMTADVTARPSPS